MDSVGSEITTPIATKPNSIAYGSQSSRIPFSSLYIRSVNVRNFQAAPNKSRVLALKEMESKEEHHEYCETRSGRSAALAFETCSKGITTLTTYHLATGQLFAYDRRLYF
jgi:hypothetical protein